MTTRATERTEALAAPARVRAVRSLGLTGTGPEAVFDRLTGLASQALNVPVALLTLLTDERRYVKSAAGPGLPPGAREGIPVGDSFCQHVVVADAPVVIEDARGDERVRLSPLVSDQGWRAYAGVPLRTRDDQVVGAFCVVDREARRWTETELDVLARIGALAVEELNARLGESLLERLRLSDIPAPMWVFDLESRRILAATDAALVQYGYSREEFLKLRVDDLRPPEEVPTMLEQLRTVGPGFSGRGVGRHCRSDGTPMDAALSTQQVDLDGRRCLAVVGIDVTEQERAESRFGALIEKATDLVSVLDAGGTIVYDSPSIERILGYRQGELHGTNALDLVHPEDRPQVAEQLRARLANPGTTGSIAYRFRHRDGSWRQFESTGSNLLEDPAVRGVVVNSRDVTEERHAEARLRRLTATSPAILFSIRLENEGMTDAWVSDNIQEILGYTREDARSLRWWSDIIHPEERDAVEAGVTELFVRDTFSHEHRVRCGDDSYKWVRAQAVVLRDQDGQATEIVGSLLDATEFRELEGQLRQAAKMEAIGRLAGGVAHDFNNMLTAIAGHTEMVLADLPEHDPLRGDMEEVRRAADRATVLTRQLLAFSRKQVLRPEVIDLGTVVGGLHQMLRRLVSEEIEVVTDAPPGAGCVEADRSQLEQVLMNLVVNARDAIDGCGRIELRVRRVAYPQEYRRKQATVPAGDYVVLSVHDTGSGIPAEVLPHIFEPFYTTKPTGQGTGLGLAMVYGIVKQSGGFVWVESEEGAGTRFEIQLPAIDRTAAVDAPNPSKGSAAGGSETILLVEDERAVRQLTEKLLTRLGYRILTAENGEAALRLAREHPRPIALLLTDMVMPQMSGGELATEMKRLHPEAHVLFMSGYTEEAVFGNSDLPSGAEFLEKPFTAATLGAAVRGTLDAG